MSKTKKLTFGMIAADMKPDAAFVSEYEYEGMHGKYTIVIRKRLPLADAMSFVSGIVGACADTDAGTYNPGVFDFALRLSTLIYYAGFSAPDMTNAESVAKAYDVVYCTELYDRVTEHIDWMQHHELIEAAREQIGYLCDCMIGTQASKMNELIAKMDEVMQSGNSVMEQLSSKDVMAQIAELGRLTGHINSEQDEMPEGDNVITLPIGSARQR